VTGAIICEPQDDLICTSQKGAVRASFTVRGHMSHGAMPLSGLNTAPALAELIKGLHRLEKEAVEKLGRDRYLGWPSFTPTVIQAPSGGAAQLNVMPGEARVLVDVRTIPGQVHDRIRKDLADLAAETAVKVNQEYIDYDRQLDLKRAHDIQVEVAFLTDRPCTKTEADDPVVAAADWATRKVLNIEPEYGGVPEPPMEPFYGP
jgi:succinyl-diaminopimelate desuccinylase